MLTRPCITDDDPDKFYDRLESEAKEYVDKLAESDHSFVRQWEVVRRNGHIILYFVI